MSEGKDKITVFYDGACPICVRDRLIYKRLAGKAGDQVCWFDITGREDQLGTLGIDPQKALTELHVMDENRQIHAEMDAYILLLQKVSLLKPLAWLIGLPIIRPGLTRLYHRIVRRRLSQSGRL